MHLLNGPLTLARASNVRRDSTVLGAQALFVSSIKLLSALIPLAKDYIPTLPIYGQKVVPAVIENVNCPLFIHMPLRLDMICASLGLLSRSIDIEDEVVRQFPMLVLDINRLASAGRFIRFPTYS